MYDKEVEPFELSEVGRGTLGTEKFRRKLRSNNKSRVEVLEVPLGTTILVYML